MKKPMKKIGGKEFGFYWTYPTKTKAQKAAKKLRSEGWNARVLTERGEKRYGHRLKWVVWRRRR